MCGRFAFFAKGQFGYESLQLPRTTPGRAVQHRAVPGHSRHSHRSGDDGTP